MRSQVDRVTSRQLLDQQMVERKVSELLRRQAELTLRHGSMEPVVERAAGEGSAVPLPTPRPDDHAGIDFSDIRGSGGATGITAYASSSETAVSSIPWPIQNASIEKTEGQSGGLFASVDQSLHRIEKEQIGRLDTLTQSAYEAADQISDALQTAGLDTQEDDNDDASGGPYLPVDQSASFQSRVGELDDALNKLDSLKKEARSYPLRNPAAGHVVTSGFGVRHDPILGELGYHSGMDFREKYGTTIRVTAPGIVTKAGWHGGYGRLVEVDHGNGITTRYGHLSSIAVAVGQKISARTAIGLSGSSGRSTGPHLHYEVRKDGHAVNPLTFIKAGRKISHFL